MGARVVTADEVLGGHAVLDIECLDRVYLNAYVPILQGPRRPIYVRAPSQSCRNNCERRSPPCLATRRRCRSLRSVDRVG